MTEILTDSDLRRYALLGAEARLAQMDKEAASIYEAFPELRKRAGNAASDGTAAAAQPRGRGRMSAAQREAARERMKRYWAQRKGTAQPDASGSSAASESTPVKAKGARARGARGPRKMSAAARKRISDAQKARWAKRRRANG